MRKRVLGQWWGRAGQTRAECSAVGGGEGQQLRRRRRRRCVINFYHTFRMCKVFLRIRRHLIYAHAIPTVPATVPQRTLTPLLPLLLLPLLPCGNVSLVAAIFSCADGRKLTNSSSVGVGVGTSCSPSARHDRAVPAAWRSCCSRCWHLRRDWDWGCSDCWSFSCAEVCVHWTPADALVLP